MASRAVSIMELKHHDITDFTVEAQTPVRMLSRLTVMNDSTPYRSPAYSCVINKQTWLLQIHMSTEGANSILNYIYIYFLMGHIGAVGTHFPASFIMHSPLMVHCKKNEIRLRC